MKSNIYHSNKWENHHFFIGIPILCHVLVPSVDKTHVLAVTVKLIWLLFLNLFSFNFVPIQNKPLRFTRFRRSYVNRPAVILTNHCQSYTGFLLDVRCSKCPYSFFFDCCVSPMIVHLCSLILLSTRVSRLLLNPRRLIR